MHERMMAPSDNNSALDGRDEQILALLEELREKNETIQRLAAGDRQDKEHELLLSKALPIAAAAENEARVWTLDLRRTKPSLDDALRHSLQRDKYLLEFLEEERTVAEAALSRLQAESSIAYDGAATEIEFDRVNVELERAKCELERVVTLNNDLRALVQDLTVSVEIHREYAESLQEIVQSQTLVHSLDALD